MGRIFFILVLCTFIFEGPIFSQELFILGERVEKGEALTFFKNELPYGKIEFLLKDILAEKVEISLDGGHTWDVMEKQDNNFVYKYRPYNDEIIKPVFLIKEKEKTYTFNPKVNIAYYKQDPTQAIMSLIGKMKTYYEMERKSRFLNLFSRSYPNFIKFEEAIQNDFYNYNNIRLNYTIYQKVFSPDYKNSIWKIKWEKKYTDLSGNQHSAEALISMKFKKEGARWVVSAMRNNTIFGSTLLGVDLYISSSDIAKTASYNVSVTVHNRGGSAVSNVSVKFYEDSAGSYNLHCTRLISNIPAGGSATVNCDFSALGPIPVNIKVIVDEENTISESNETNNTAVKNINLG